jgi:hypothetical protein
LTRFSLIEILVTYSVRRPRKQNMGKATELDDYQDRHPLTPEKVAARYPKVPELRLRADVPAVEIDEATTASNVLAHMRSENVGTIALHEPIVNVTAVVMPVERYLELVGSELANDPFHKEAGPRGIAPTEAALAAVHVEQVDPSDTWTRGSII